MKKKTIIAVLCLLVLIIPTTIYAGNSKGCSGHKWIEDPKYIDHEVEDKGACLQMDVYYQRCAKGCGYRRSYGGSAIYTKHKCARHSCLGPNTYEHVCECGQVKLHNSSLKTHIQ